MIWRSKAYESWVRGQPCMVCGAEGEVHHIKGVGHFSGMALKADSILTMPLCHTHHMEMHENPEVMDDQWEYIVRTVLKAVREGVLECTV